MSASCTLTKIQASPIGGTMLHFHVHLPGLSDPTPVSIEVGGEMLERGVDMEFIEQSVCEMALEGMVTNQPRRARTEHYGSYLHPRWIAPCCNVDVLDAYEGEHRCPKCGRPMLLTTAEVPVFIAHVIEEGEA